MISELMTFDHRECDVFFENIDKLINNKDFVAARENIIHWMNKNFKHFEVEETAIFPTLASQLGIVIPPVQMMIHEHHQIRNLITEIVSSFETADIETTLGNIETCFMMIQQHNMKEENILYPLIDRELSHNDELDLTIKAMLK